LVKNLDQWPYSSYLDYAGLRNGSLCDKEQFISLTGLTTTDVISCGDIDLDDDYIRKFY
jgi:putative transposase